MATAYGNTLELSDAWDLQLDNNGNIKTVTDDYAVAQNVANAFRLFTDDAWYNPERGISHFLIELKKSPLLSVLKVRLKQAALNTAGVQDASISLLTAEGRDLTGIASLTLDNGEKLDVNF